MIILLILMMMMVVLKMGDGGDTWGTQYSWTVDKTACLRNIRSAAASPTSEHLQWGRTVGQGSYQQKLNFANVFVTDTSMCFCVVRKTFWNLNKTLSMLSKVGIENFYDQTTRNNSTQMIALSKEPSTRRRPKKEKLRECSFRALLTLPCSGPGSGPGSGSTPRSWRRAAACCTARCGGGASPRQPSCSCSRSTYLCDHTS